MKVRPKGAPHPDDPDRIVGMELLEIPTGARRVKSVLSETQRKQRPKRSQTHPAFIVARERGEQALQLRKEGLTYTEIAEKLGLTPSGVSGAIKAAMDRITREPAEEVLKLELARLDELYKHARLRALGLVRQRQKGVSVMGQLDAIDSCLKIMQRRARLLGLDSPDKTELMGKDGAPLLTAGVLVVPGMAVNAAEWEKEMALGNVIDATVTPTGEGSVAPTPG